MMSKDSDKFVEVTTEKVLKNWEKLVAKNIKNEAHKEIPMIDVLENLGIELTTEEKEYFKDKVLTYVEVIGDNFTDMPEHKLTVTVNYIEYNPEELAAVNEKK